VAEDQGLGPVMQAVNGFHNAWGIVNRNNGHNYTAEFYSMGHVIHSVVPVIVQVNNTIELEWFTSGQSCLTVGLNASYFSIGIQHVARINGTMLAKFMAFVKQDNITVTDYQLLYIVDEWRGPLNTTFYLNSSACYDFIWRGMQFLYNNDIQLNDNITYKHDFVYFSVRSPPVRIDYNNSTWRKRINAYYVALHLNIHDTKLQFAEFLADLVLGDKVTSTLVFCFIFIDESFVSSCMPMDHIGISIYIVHTSRASTYKITFLAKSQVASIIITDELSRTCAE
jgi:hypothetical protein